jgi:hypothetical protein
MERKLNDNKVMRMRAGNCNDATNRYLGKRQIKKKLEKICKQQATDRHGAALDQQVVRSNYSTQRTKGLTACHS